MKQNRDKISKQFTLSKRSRQKQNSLLNLSRSELQATQEILKDIELGKIGEIDKLVNIIEDLKQKNNELILDQTLSEEYFEGNERLIESLYQTIENLQSQLEEAQTGNATFNTGGKKITRKRRKPHKRRLTKRLRSKKFPRKYFSLRKREK